jgi:hypothetical protein
MGQTASSIKQQKNDAAVARVDLKFEVAIVPVSDVDRAKAFTQRSGGGSMTISSMATIFASFS